MYVHGRIWRTSAENTYGDMEYDDDKHYRRRMASNLVSIELFQQSNNELVHKDAGRLRETDCGTTHERTG